MFFICTFNGSEVTFIHFHFYLNGGLHAVSIGKPSEQMSSFWMVQFLKTESKPNFGFPHIPTSSALQKFIRVKSYYCDNRFAILLRALLKVLCF